MYQFEAFNLLFSSDIYFPELVTNSDYTRDIDVKIVLSQVSDKGIDNAFKTGPFFQVSQHSLWLNIPEVARFLVVKGEEVRVEPYHQVDEASIRAFILTSCFRAILMQRKAMVLYGNAIKVGDAAVSFVAPSGFGKSTLCQLFLKKGYPILTDDICAINHKGEVLPSYPQINLWGSIASQLMMDMTSHRVIRPSLEKYAVPLEGAHYSQPLPLKAMYILDFHKKEELEIYPIVSKKSVLKNGNFQSSYLDRDDPFHDEQCDQVASRIDIFQLNCPRWNYTMRDLGHLLSHFFDEIEAHLNQRGCVDGDQ